MYYKKLHHTHTNTPSTPHLVVVCILIGISSLLVIEYYGGRLPVGVDQLRQYEAAKLFANGKGLSVMDINHNDLSSPHVEPLTAFPPGFSVLTAPLFRISDDIRVVQFILALSNFILFLICTYVLLKRITSNVLNSIQFAGVFLFISVNGTFVILAGSTDLINVNLVLLATICLLNSIRSTRTCIHISFACLFTVLTVYFRYAYFPVLLSVPLFFAVRSIVYNTKEWKKVGTAALSVVAFSIPVLGHIFYLNSKSGYIQEKTGDGFTLYWENLSQVSPFPLHGFFDVFPFLRAIGYASDYGYDRGYVYPPVIDLVFYAASLFILAPIIISAIPYLKSPQIKSPVFNVLWFGTVVSSGLIMLIYCGSLINPSQHTAYNWSWVKIFRYFAVPVFFIQMGYYSLVHRTSRGILKVFVTSVVVLSFTYSAALKIYNYTFNYRPFDFYENIKLMAPNKKQWNSYLIHKALPATNEARVVLAGSSLKNSLYNAEYFFSLNNATYALVESVPDLKTTQPIDVFVILTPEDKDAIELIKLYQGSKYSEIDENISIYQFSLSP